MGSRLYSFLQLDTARESRLSKYLACYQSTRMMPRAGEPVAALTASK
jgi:hypothetical protein